MLKLLEMKSISFSIILCSFLLLVFISDARKELKKDQHDLNNNYLGEKDMSSLKDFDPKQKNFFVYPRYSSVKSDFDPNPKNFFVYPRYSSVKSDSEQKSNIQETDSKKKPNKDMIVKSNVNAENSVLKLHSMDNSPLIIFFRKDDLQVGKKMNLPPLDDPISNPPPLLSKEEAESIPFSYRQLPNLLRLFSISPASPQEKAMEDALRICEAKPINGETKFCATSFESMLDFVRSSLGLDSNSNDVKAISTVHVTKSKYIQQNYTITRQTKEISTPIFLGCHTMAYPYAIFYCHTSIKTKMFKTSFVGDINGDSIDALTVCHFDTSEWSPDHLSFRLTGTKPGLTEICHFFPTGHMVWVPFQA